MEPNINYQSSMGETPVGSQKIYGRRKGCGSMGCFGLIGALVLIVVIVLAGIFFVYPALTPNKIKGDFLDMAIVTTKEGKQNLWILTDGSFNFIQTTKSPGRTSTGRKCYFCKTWTYIYDPAGGNIIKKTKNDMQDIITHVDMVYDNGKVWEFTREYGENDPKIEAYNAETGELVMDTKNFISKHPDLSAGLTAVHYEPKTKMVNLSTKDGKQYMEYDIENDRLYKNAAEQRDEIEKETETISIPVLAAENSSGPRKKLYKVTGPKGKILTNITSLESYANNPHSMDFFVGGKSEPVSDKIYLEGIIYYQDAETAIIIHIDQLGKKSSRMMTCVDINSGKEKWTIPQSDLFKHMKIDENDDAFSSIFFTKDKIQVKRQGNLVVLQMEGEGLMGFDFNTGKKLWTLDI
jgi:outer membrane protein assembly factor BamB